MARKKKIKGPTQLELLEPVFAALQQLGGSATIDEIRDRVIENEQFPDEIVDEPHAGSASGKEIRLTQDENILISYRTDTSYSYKFWGGGTVNYNPAGAQYVYPTVQESDKLMTKTFKAKIFNFTGICQNYVSSSGKTQQYQLVIVSPGDINITGVVSQ